MEFTNPGVNGQDPPRTLPLSGYFTDKTRGAVHPLGYDLREPRSLHGALDREILEKARRMREDMIAYEMARREMMMQMEYSDPRKVLPSNYHQAMDFLISPWSHLRAGAEVTAFEGKMPPSQSRGIEAMDFLLSRAGAEVTAFEGKMAPSQSRGTEGGNISGTKRKAESPPPRAAEAIDVPSVNNNNDNNNMKKTEEDGLYCKVCKVSSTSKQTLMDHLKGKKHKSKEGAAAKSENPRFPFWCDICKVGCDTENVMSCHKKGRKHVKRLGITTEAKGVNANVVDKDGIIEDIKNEKKEVVFKAGDGGDNVVDAAAIVP